MRNTSHKKTVFLLTVLILTLFSPTITGVHHTVKPIQPYIGYATIGEYNDSAEKDYLYLCKFFVDETVNVKAINVYCNGTKRSTYANPLIYTDLDGKPYQLMSSVTPTIMLAILPFPSWVTNFYTVRLFSNNYFWIGFVPNKEITYFFDVSTNQDTYVVLGSFDNPPLFCPDDGVFLNRIVSVYAKIIV